MMFPRMLLLAAAVFITSACASSKVSTQVLRPAEINMAGYEKVVFGKFKGSPNAPGSVQAADEIRNRLMDRMANTPPYQVLETETLEEMLDEKALASLGLTSGDNSSEMSAAAAFVTGRVTACRTNHNMEFAWTDQNGVTYMKATATAEVGATVRVVDLATRDVLALKNLNKTHTVEGATSPAPPPVSADGAFTLCYQQIVDEFMRQIAPFTQEYTVELFHVGDSKTQNMAFKYFKARNYGEAVASYERILEAERTRQMAKPNPKRLSRCLHNLGIAYMYDGQFSAAIDVLEEAKTTYPDMRYASALVEARTRMAELEELKNAGNI